MRRSAIEWTTEQMAKIIMHSCTLQNIAQWTNELMSYAVPSQLLAADCRLSDTVFVSIQMRFAFVVPSLDCAPRPDRMCVNAISHEYEYKRRKSQTQILQTTTAANWRTRRRNMPFAMQSRTASISTMFITMQRCRCCCCCCCMRCAKYFILLFTLSLCFFLYFPPTCSILFFSISRAAHTLP